MLRTRVTRDEVTRCCTILVLTILVLTAVGFGAIRLAVTTEDNDNDDDRYASLEIASCSVYRRSGLDVRSAVHQLFAAVASPGAAATLLMTCRLPAPTYGRAKCRGDSRSKTDRSN